LILSKEFGKLPKEEGPENDYAAAGRRELKANCLILFLFLTTHVGRFGANLLVILLEGGKILTGLGELSFLHTLTDVPVDEGTLGVHKIELMIEAGEDLSDGSGVGQHADGTLDLGEVTTWNDGWWLVVDTTLETSWAPVNELDGALGLDTSNRSVDVLWNNVTTVHKAASHVLSVTWITLGHHGGWLEDGVGDLRDAEVLVVGLLGADDWSV